MKLKMYFLAMGDDVISGPYFNLEQAYEAKQKVHPVSNPLVRIVKFNTCGQFDEIEL